MPEGFTQASQETVDNFTVTIYTGSGTATDAESSFKTALQDAGWSSMGEMTAGGFTGPGFEKGNEIAVVYAAGLEGRVTVTLVIGPKPA